MLSHSGYPFSFSVFGFRLLPSNKIAASHVAVSPFHFLPCRERAGNCVQLPLVPVVVPVIENEDEDENEIWLWRASGGSN